MKNIKFIEEPGFVYDLMFMFMLYFNKDNCVTKCINYNKSESDAEYYSGLLSDLENVPEELFPFFWQKPDGSSFITSYYFEKYKSNFSSDYSFEMLKSELSNRQKLFENMIDFYFPGTKKRDKEELGRSITYASKFVKSSSYSDTVKSGLYLFFINPGEAVDILIAELNAKAALLRDRFNKSTSRIQRLQEAFNAEDFIKKLNCVNEEQIDAEDIEYVYVSYCVSDKNNVWFNVYEEDELVVILGYDCMEALDYMVERSSVPELYVFGNAIAEKNRVEILNMMLEKGEITVKEIEKRLGLTGTNAYYHLMLMIKANMLKTRVQGRVVFYSINNHYFTTIKAVLNKYE